MSTYVQITRPEFEEWLAGRGFPWSLKDGSVGLYRLHLSDRVAIEISSTVCSADTVMDKAAASMKLKLVSRVTGKTLNKKAQGQSHFKRTTNWRGTWADGVERMMDAYFKHPEFYERIANPDEPIEKPREEAPKYVNDAGFPCDDPETYERRLRLLRELWKAAANKGDEWTKRFAESVGTWYKENRSLTPKQTETIKRKLKDLEVL